VDKLWNIIQHAKEMSCHAIDDVEETLMCITKRDSIYNNPNCMISFFLEWGDGV
jgi:hypothetical protein